MGSQTTGYSVAFYSELVCNKVKILSHLKKLCQLHQHPNPFWTPLPRMHIWPTNMAIPDYSSHHYSSQPHLKSLEYTHLFTMTLTPYKNRLWTFSHCEVTISVLIPGLTMPRFLVLLFCFFLVCPALCFFFAFFGFCLVLMFADYLTFLPVFDHEYSVTFWVRLLTFN